MKGLPMHVNGKEKKKITRTTTSPQGKCVMMVILRLLSSVVQISCNVTLMICVSKYFARVALLSFRFLRAESNKILTCKLNKKTMLLESHTCKFENKCACQYKSKISKVGFYSLLCIV